MKKNTSNKKNSKAESWWKKIF